MSSQTGPQGTTVRKRVEEKVTYAMSRTNINNNNVEAMLTCMTSSAVTNSSAQLLKRRPQVRKVMLILLEKE